MFFSSSSDNNYNRQSKAYTHTALTESIALFIDNKEKTFAKLG